MWTCAQCGRVFAKTQQPHSCRKVPLAEHFLHKEKAQELFENLVKQIGSQIGACRTISLPCCIHLFGHYDFLAALPKKDKLEIRFALNRQLDSPRLKQAVPLSATAVKNCLEITATAEINAELMQWINESYYAKDE